MGAAVSGLRLIRGYLCSRAARKPEPAMVALDIRSICSGRDHSDRSQVVADLERDGCGKE